MISNDNISKIVSDVRTYSMVPPEAIALTIYAAIKSIDRNLPGDLAEFGVWRGGCSFAMLLAQRLHYGRIIKPIWMFDSFEGLPPVDERDGPAAKKYQTTPEASDYFDNCRAPLESIHEAIKKFGFAPAECFVVPGWFDATIKQNIPDLKRRGLAVLRIDCDWYKSVKTTLDLVEPLVTENGYIIIDDYFTWDGCARATHDYLSQNNLPYRIECQPSRLGAWMVKQTKGRPVA